MYRKWSVVGIAGAGCLHSVRLLQNKHQEGAGVELAVTRDLVWLKTGIWCGCTSLGGQGQWVGAL